MHSDKAKYCTYVLWLSGCSKQTIACWTGLAESQVRGIIYRSPWHDRSAIPGEMRQRLLDDYRAVRFNEDGTSLDGGLLDGHDWVMHCEPARRIHHPAASHTSISAC